MGRTLLDIWCGKPWLYATYLLGIAMFVVLVVSWEDWPVPQRIMGLLSIALPLHVFEELTYPSGFHFMMNKLIQNSDAPLAYPENRLTDMITNFGAELLFISLTFLSPMLGNTGVVFAAAFGLGETAAHTAFSVVTLRHYRPMGKRTLYSPGFATAWGVLFGIGAYSAYWPVASQTFAMSDLWGLAFVALLVGLLIRLPFIVSYRTKSTRFAYADRGYFDIIERGRGVPSFRPSSRSTPAPAGTTSRRAGGG